MQPLGELLKEYSGEVETAHVNGPSTPSNGSSLEPLIPSAQHRPLWKGDKEEVQGFGSKSAYENQDEQYHHRLVCYLKALGLTNVDIAKRVNRTPAHINYLVKQPFMEKLILEEIEKSGRKGIHAVLEGAGVKAAQKLVALMDGLDDAGKVKEVSPETVRKTCNDVLNRLLGMPKQPIDINTGDLSKMSDAELAEIAAGGRS